MKRVQLTLCAFCFMVVGCSEMFTWPFRLFTDLIPIAIKYAPYALMFLEETDSNAEIQLASDTPMPKIIEQALEKKLAGKNIRILAIPMETERDKALIQKLQKTYGQKYKVRIINTYCDFNDDTHYRQIAALVDDHQIPFFALGTLETLSTLSAQQVFASLDAPVK